MYCLTRLAAFPSPKIIVYQTIFQSINDDYLDTLIQCMKGGCGRQVQAYGRQGQVNDIQGQAYGRQAVAYGRRAVAYGRPVLAYDMLELEDGRVSPQDSGLFPHRSLQPHIHCNDQQCT